MRSLVAISGLSSAHFFNPGFASRYLSKLHPYFLSLKLHLGPSFFSLSAFEMSDSQSLGAVWQVLLKPSFGSPGGQFGSTDVLVTAPVSLKFPEP